MLKNEKGVATVLTLMVMVVVGLIGVTLTHVSNTDTVQVQRDEDSAQAYYYAKSGVELAIGKIMENGPNYLLDQEEPEIFYGSLGETTFSTERSNPPNHSIEFSIYRENNDFIIESTGIFRRGGAEGTQVASNAVGYTISCAEVFDGFDDNVGGGDDNGDNNDSGAPLALFADGDISLSRTPSISGDVCTNSTRNGGVSFTPDGTKIRGNLYVGYNAVNANSVVSHPTYTNLEEHITQLPIKKLSSYRVYPMPVFPNYPDDLLVKPDFKTPWVSGLYYEINQDGYYNLIEATSGRTITFDLDAGERVIRVNHLNIENGNIVLRNTGKDGRLIIYVDNKFTFGGGEINYGGDINRLIIYYKGNYDVDISGSRKFTGSIYVGNNNSTQTPPNITLGGSCEFTGNIISGGNKVTVQGGSEKALRGLLYAPLADVQVKASAIITGTAITKTCALSGGGSDLIIADPDLDTTFFDSLEWESGKPPSIYSTTTESGSDDAEPVLTPNKNWWVGGRWKNL